MSSCIINLSAYSHTILSCIINLSAYSHTILSIICVNILIINMTRYNMRRNDNSLVTAHAW